MQLNRADPVPRRRAGAEIAWVPELSWAAELKFDEQALSDLRKVHPPFVYEHVGHGPDALVVENHHPYVSLTRARRRR